MIKLKHYSGLSLISDVDGDVRKVVCESSCFGMSSMLFLFWSSWGSSSELSKLPGENPYPLPVMTALHYFIIDSLYLIRSMLQIIMNTDSLHHRQYNLAYLNLS